jgi:2',3'-cyclic-nucleotide 2'-phosphodiesterase (5'-nucleotidase family)/endonuclease/exonuclease/phosphatase family metal-dependent hydrolase
MTVQISEFQPNPPGADPADASFELSGPAGQSFEGHVISIESDAGSSAGTIDRATPVSGVFDANGLLTITIPDLENPSFTVALVQGFTGAVGDDLDTDNDGVADDAGSLGAVLDAIGIPDTADDEATLYGAQLGGTNFAFTGAEPQLVFRAASNGDLYAVNVIDVLSPGAVFDATGTDVTAGAFDSDPTTGPTFGASNPGLADAPQADFTLELLHFTDQEANAATIDNIDNLSAVLNALRAEDLGDDGIADNTLTLSSGDVIIPGLFFDASEAVFGSAGIADIQIQNELGLDAAALGNHEFDLGTEFLAGLIDGSAPGDFSALSGTELDGLDFEGALFPYLSANLGFDTDPNLAPLEVAGGLPTETLQRVVTSSSVSDVNGELIGIVGATVPTIDSISSAGTDLGIFPEVFDANPTDAQLDALAAVLQAEVDQLLADNPSMDKVVMLSHMQQISIELDLAERLEGVDIIVAGGSNTRLFDDDDRIRDGDSEQGQYPLFVTNAGGTATAVVNTDANYKYVGRLVMDFDADGNLITESYDETVSGAYATDDQGVADLGAEGLIDPEIDAITDAIQAQIVATESNVFGVSDVFLNGNRSGTFAPDDPDGVRTQETNLGNLTADANLAYANDIVAAEDLGEPVVISIKNGGGIRASIGEIVVPAGGTEAERVPNSAVIDENSAEVKPEGGISQNDIQTVLAFNNGLVLLDMTKEEIKQFLEGAVSALPDGVSGGFPQIAGLEFSFDETRTAQVLDDATNEVTVPGERVQNVAIVDADGTVVSVLVADGEIVGDATESFRVVTLDFLANGGDEILSTLSNPDRVDLQDLDADGLDDETTTGAATFADDGSEQDALAEYLNDNFNPANGGIAFDTADTGPEADERIQNLTFREDTVGEVETMNPDAPEASGVLEATIFAEFDSGAGGDGAEVVAHEDGKLYVTNGEFDTIDIFDLADTDAGPVRIDLAGLPGYDGVQSVAVANGLIAVAIARAPEEITIFGSTQSIGSPGFVAFFDAETLGSLGQVDVGNLPDQLTFNDAGTQLLVAGEGEKNDESDNDNNPLGTVAVIDIDAADPAASNVELIDFTDFNGLEDAAREAGIRIQDGVNFGADVEPEYVAVTADGQTAFVSLQENNAIARIDLVTNTVADVFSLGTVDFSQPGQEIDADDNGVIDIRNFDNLVGFRMADGIDTFEVGGTTYLVTANEGDSRGFDEDRVGDLVEDGLIDESVDTTGLERLEVSTIDGDTDGDGDIDVLHSFSSRSFSIFDGDGNLVFDSGSEFEAIIAELAPERFNDDDGDDGEDLSDAKGPEPEAITIGEVAGKIYAFIGLERDSGIMIYDVTSPADASFVSYIPPLHVENAEEGETARHAPEVITFIETEDSQPGNAQIAVSYEVSGTTIVYDLVDTTLVPIYEIQGAGHVSALEGEEVDTIGIVTAVDFNGYYLQDETGDGDDATSDGIFVFVGNGNAEGVSVGDEVRVSGTVSEFIPGGAGTGNLSTTQITDIGAEGTRVLSSGNVLPEAVILGEAGRNPPTDVIISADELPVNLQDVPGTFNPEVDGIDFYESLEGMRVTVDNPTAIATTNRFNETWLVADNGANVTGGGTADGGLTDRSGLIINADPDGYGDLNPERIQIQYDNDLLPEDFDAPTVTQGDTLSDVTGVVGYGFGNFEVLVTESFEVETASTNEAEITDLVTPDGPPTFPNDLRDVFSEFLSGRRLDRTVERFEQQLERAEGNERRTERVEDRIERTLDRLEDRFGSGGDDGGQLTVATYNVLNLTSNFDSGDDDDADADQMAMVGEHIAVNLGSPDIVALQEIQDNSGVNFNAQDGVLDADETLQALVDAIEAAGGPRYEFVSAIVDEEGETGGVPGGNIRNAFLWNPDRVDAESFVTLESAQLTTLGVSDPEAFNDANARDPLLGVFEFEGEEITLINNHWESRSGSDPIFGGPQPFEQNGDEARAAQAQVVNEVVDILLALDPEARVGVLGDLNTFEFTNELEEILEGTADEPVLTNLVDFAENGDAFTFNFQGNMQNLDHILVTDSLLNGVEVDYVHVNTDLVDSASDHDPIVAIFDFSSDNFAFV